VAFWARARSRRPGYSARLVTAVLAGIVLSLAGCAGSGWLSGTALCEAAGGTYTGGTCSRWGPAQQAAQEMCEAGAVKVNGLRAKSAHEVRESNLISIRHRGQITTVRVLTIPSKQTSKREAPSLYETISVESVES